MRVVYHDDYLYTKLFSGLKFLFVNLFKLLQLFSGLLKCKKGDIIIFFLRLFKIKKCYFEKGGF